MIETMNRLVQRCLPYFKQAHTLTTASDQHSPGMAALQQALARFVQLCLVRNRHTQGQFGFWLVRCERSYTLEPEKRAMRINYHDLIHLTRSRNTGFNDLRTNYAILIVREHNRVNSGQHMADIVDD